MSLPDGVYLALPKPRYFAEPRLGSTDLKVLASPDGAADWWYRSERTNPDFQAPERTPERDFGAALHTLVLEGEDAFDAEFVTRPKFYLTRETGKMKPWNGNALACQEWLAEHAAWTVLTEDAARRVRHMAALVLNHPQFAEVLRAGLPEVTVLFQLDGQPMRARFDYLLPQFLIDLKSYGGHTRGRDHRDKALRIVTDLHYDVQRFVYDWARQELVRFVAEMRVFDANPEQLAWLQQLAAEPTWSWVWLFYQRRDDRIGRAPIVLPVERPRFDVTWDTGRRKAEAALTNYRAMVRRFGLETPWAVVEPMWRPNDHDFPAWLSDLPGPIAEGGEHGQHDDHTNPQDHGPGDQSARAEGV